MVTCTGELFGSFKFMENLEDWLWKLGLSCYFDLFVENDLDLDILPEVSEAHLEALGVSLGHRLKLVRAIRQLSLPAQIDTAPIPVSDHTSGILPPENAPAEVAERRHLTVMFVDLVGSTALSTRLDPEDLRDVIRSFQEAATREIKQFDGFISRYMGDGILAYFGWPRAHEDDAERAVRAGLAANKAVAALVTPDGVALAARSGIATGLVVVGDVIGEGASEEEAVVGETPNLAARLQGVAEPGQLVVSDVTRRLVGELFQFELLGNLSLKGMSVPVPSFLVGLERVAPSRYHASRKSGQLPLIGREAEFMQLQQLWKVSCDGDGQTVVVSGEAGIGKSRVIDAFCNDSEAENANCIILQCSPHHTQSALYPVWQWLLRASGAGELTTDNERFAKISEYFSRWSATQQIAGLAAANLAISAEPVKKFLDQGPDQLRKNTLSELVSFFLLMSKTGPVLIVVEDEHWIDPSSQEFFEELAARTTTERLMLVLTTRSKVAQTLSVAQDINRISLNRLGRSASADIIKQLTGGRKLPDELLGKLIAKTDGVPLYVEELTKTVLESGQLSEKDDSYESSVGLDSVEVPSTLQDSLMARLDRLWPIREIAQTAAVIGREFSFNLLESVVSTSNSDLVSALEKLLDSGLIYQRDHLSNIGYIFKHALVRDAAYNSLLKSRRREIHAVIANVLANDERFSDIAEPQLLAKHYLNAGNYLRAVEFNLAAAQKALSNSSNNEALVHAAAGLGLINRLEAKQRDNLQQSLYFCSAMAQRILRGFHSDEYLDAITRAGNLAESNNDTDTRINCVRGQFNHYFNRGQHKDGNIIIETQLEPLLQKLDSVSPGSTQGANYLYRGALQNASDELTEMLGILDRAEKYPERTYVINPVTSTLANLGWTKWLLGYPEQALADGMLAVDTAREISQPFSFAMAVVWVGHTQCAAGYTDNWGEVLREATELIDEYDIQAWAPRVRFLSGKYMASNIDRPQFERGLTEMREAMEHIESRGSKLSWTWMCAELALEYLKLSQWQLCEKILLSGITHGEQNDEKFWLSELYRLKGCHLIATVNNKSKAMPWFKKSLDVALSAGARSCVLRAQMEICRQYPGDHQAVKSLHDTASSFPEGQQTIDLLMAREFRIDSTSTA